MISNRCARKSLVTNCNSIISKNYSRFLVDSNDMESVSQLKPLPKTKFRELKGNKDKVKEYEFKSKHLRIYAIQQKNGKIVIMGGYKNTQTKDINTFRALKMQYLNSLK